MTTGDLPDGLEEAWDDFARHLRRKGRRPATADIYRKSYESFWRWALGHDLVADPGKISRRDVDRWVDHLVDAHTPTGARIRWANLRPFWSWWAKEMDTPNPFDGTHAPQPEDTPVPVVDLDDIRALLGTCNGKTIEDRRDNALIRVLVDTGARLGELVAMTVDGWDRKHDTIMLSGKTGRRMVTLSASTGEALSRYMRMRRQHPHAGRPELWLSRKGALTDSGVAQVLKHRCDLAGVPRINPHKFRHTWAHMFRAEGGSEGDLLYLAGWKSTAMAHRYGRSAAAERAREAQRRIALGDRL